MRVLSPIALLLLSSVASQAATFNSGQSETIDTLLVDEAGEAEAAEVSNGTDLTITNGGQIFPTERLPAVIVEDTSTLTIEEGAVITSPPVEAERQRGAIGVFVTDEATVTITGGQITGGAGLAGVRGERAGSGLDLSEEADFFMSGGSITGGEAFSQSGRAGIGLDIDMSDYSEEGQIIFSGGTITGARALTAVEMVLRPI